jgi:hypothetical protein
LNDGCSPELPKVMTASPELGDGDAQNVNEPHQSGQLLICSCTAHLLH